MKQHLRPKPKLAAQACASAAAAPMAWRHRAWRVLVLVGAVSAAACASAPTVSGCTGLEGTCRSLDLARHGLARTAMIHQREAGPQCAPPSACLPAPRPASAEPVPAQADVVSGLSLLFKRQPELFVAVREALGAGFPARPAQPVNAEPCAGMQATCQAIEKDRLALAASALLFALENGKCGVYSGCTPGPKPTDDPLPFPGVPPKGSVVQGLLLLFNLYPDLYGSTMQLLGPDFPR
jgi:hypothetical protein